MDGGEARAEDAGVRKRMCEGLGMRGCISLDGVSLISGFVF